MLALVSFLLVVAGVVRCTRWLGVYFCKFLAGCVSELVDISCDNYDDDDDATAGDDDINNADNDASRVSVARIIRAYHADTVRLLGEIHYHSTMLARENVPSSTRSIIVRICRHKYLQCEELNIFVLFVC